MTFTEAMDQMFNRGKTIKRKKWPFGRVLEWSDEFQTATLYREDGETETYAMLRMDYMAKDWEIDA